jgi:hypothetical protein
MKTKTFDCVAMKRRGAARVAHATKGMDTRQQLAFWQTRTQVLKRQQQTRLQQAALNEA